MSNKQFGKKVGKHAHDFGLDPGNAESREKILAIINDIHDNPDEVVDGEFRGQDEEVTFYIKKSDVVITTHDHEFVTVMKVGITNERVKEARSKKV